VTPPQEAQFNSMMNILREVLRVKAKTASEPAWIIFDEFDKFINILSVLDYLFIFFFFFSFMCHSSLDIFGF
jgi:hypothetical protein